MANWAGGPQIFPGPPAQFAAPAAPFRAAFGVTGFAWNLKRSAGVAAGCWRQGVARARNILPILAPRPAAAGRGAELARAAAAWPAAPRRALFGVTRCAWRQKRPAGSSGRGKPAGISCYQFSRRRRQWRRTGAGGHGQLRRMFRSGFPAKTGPGNRPTAPTGGGPRLRVAPPTNCPISGWRENLRFSARLLGKSDNRV